MKSRNPCELEDIEALTPLHGCCCGSDSEFNKIIQDKIDEIKKQITNINKHIDGFSDEFFSKFIQGDQINTKVINVSETANIKNLIVEKAEINGKPIVSVDKDIKENHVLTYDKATHTLISPDNQVTGFVEKAELALTAVDNMHNQSGKRILTEDDLLPKPEGMVAIKLGDNDNLDSYSKESDWGNVYYAEAGNKIVNKPKDVDAFAFLPYRNGATGTSQILIDGSKGTLYTRSGNSLQGVEWKELVDINGTVAHSLDTITHKASTVKGTGLNIDDLQGSDFHGKIYDGVNGDWVGGVLPPDIVPTETFHLDVMASKSNTIQIYTISKVEGPKTYQRCCIEKVWSGWVEQGSGGGGGITPVVTPHFISRQKCTFPGAYYYGLRKPNLESVSEGKTIYLLSDCVKFWKPKPGTYVDFVFRDPMDMYNGQNKEGFAVPSNELQQLGFFLSESWHLEGEILSVVMDENSPAPAETADTPSVYPLIPPGPEPVYIPERFFFPEFRDQHDQVRADENLLEFRIDHFWIEAGQFDINPITSFEKRGWS